MSDFQILVERVVVRDQWKSVDADRDRRVEADLASSVDYRGRRARTGVIRTMRHLEVLVRVVVVAYDAKAVGADSDRGPEADHERVVDRRRRSARARHVRAMSDFQEAEGAVEIA